MLAGAGGADDVRVLGLGDLRLAALLSSGFLVGVFFAAVFLAAVLRTTGRPPFDSGRDRSDSFCSSSDQRIGGF